MHYAVNHVPHNWCLLVKLALNLVDLMVEMIYRLTDKGFIIIIFNFLTYTDLITHANYTYIMNETILPRLLRSN